MPAISLLAENGAARGPHRHRFLNIPMNARRAAAPLKFWQQLLPPASCRLSATKIQRYTTQIVKAPQVCSTGRAQRKSTVPAAAARTWQQRELQGTLDSAASIQVVNLYSSNEVRLPYVSSEPSTP
jgi:hypothetical protein